MICPYKYYQEVRTGGAVEVAPLYSLAGTFPIGSNQEVIAGASGKRIRVMGYAVQSGSTQGIYGFINGSGGTALSSFVAPAETLHPFLMPITDSGYFETSTGTGLFINISSASVTVNIFYIIYTP